MDLSKDLFEAISVQAVRATEPKVVHPEAEPDNVYWFDRLKVTADPAPRSYKAGNVLAFCQVVADWAKHAVTPPAQGPAVWYHRETLFCYRDESQRLDQLVYPLAFTKQLQTLMTLGGKNSAMEQKALLRLLRIDLHGCCEDSLISLLRRVVIKAESGSVGAVVAGKSSMTREMKAEVTGTGELPETVNLLVPVFEDPDWKGSILCALEVNPEAQLPFNLIPLAGQIEAAVREAEAVVGGMVLDNLTHFLGGGDPREGGSPETPTVPVYFGSP